MSGTTISPNTGNLQVGKGIVYFKKTGDSEYRDLGNVTELVLSPDMDTLEHFTSRLGVKSKDLTIILEKKATTKFTMEEMTPANSAIMLLASVDEAAVGGPKLDIFSESSVTGSLKFVGTNDVGPKCTAEFFNISITPSGDYGFITDEWNNMEVTADVLVATSGPNAGKFGYIQWTDITVGS
jgi:hypothetical protein